MGALSKPTLTTLLTLGALLLAAALRFWKLGWGLSASLYFPDERHVWTPYFLAFQPLEWASFLRPDRASAFTYPSLYGNLVGLSAATARAAGWIAPPWENVFQSLHVARIVSATAGVATVGLVALAGRRMFDAGTGLAAALLMALVPLEAIQAHYANVDTLLLALLAAELVVAGEIATSGSTPWALVGGLVAGLAFGTKYNGLALTAFVAWAGLEAAWSRRSWRPLLSVGLGALAGFGLGFAVACPACLIQSDRWLAALSFLSTASNPESLLFWRVQLVPTLGWIGHPLIWQVFAALPFALGWPVWLLAMTGVGLAFWRHTVADRVLLVALAAWFLPMATSTVDTPRYVLPLGPALMILAGRLVTSLPGRRTMAAVLGVVCLYTLALTHSQLSRLNYDQQGAVAHWIRTSVPERSDGLPRRVGMPYMLWSYYRLTRPIGLAGMKLEPLRPEQWFTADVDAFVLPDPHVVMVHRSHPGTEEERAVDRLVGGAGGFREAARWESSYVDRSSYVRLDPSFAGDHVLGELGFRVYVRDAGPTAPVPGPSAATSGG